MMRKPILEIESTEKKARHHEKKTHSHTETHTQQTNRILLNKI